MVLETDPVIFSNWCLHALWFFPAMLLGIGVVALAIGYTVAAVRYGPLRGGDVTFQLVKAGRKTSWASRHGACGHWPVWRSRNRCAAVCG